MSQPRAHWFVLTGGPSVGKTTTLDLLAKKGYKTSSEASRQLIDEALSKGLTAQQLRLNEGVFQENVFRQKMANESSLDPKGIVFIDRGLHDTVAYLEYYGYPIPAWITDAVSRAKYGKVFLLEPLTKYSPDYARTEDPEFAEAITGLLIASYKKVGIEPVIVPTMSVEPRVELILRHRI